MARRPLALVVLVGSSALLVLAGALGIRQLVEPSSPRSLDDLVQRIEAAGAVCGPPMADAPEQVSLTCRVNDARTLQVDYHPGAAGDRYSGGYMDLRTEYGTLTGDDFTVLGPFEDVTGLQPQLGGRLARVPR